MESIKINWDEMKNGQMLMNNAFATNNDTLIRAVKNINEMIGVIGDIKHTNANLKNELQSVKNINKDLINTMGFIKESNDALISSVNYIKNKNSELQIEVEQAKEEYEKIKEVTYVLATDDGKMKELTKTIQKLTYNITGGKHTYEDMLFHRALTDGCYKHLYNVFQVNTYKRIKIDSFEIAMTTIYNWFGNKQNVKRTINKKLNEYKKTKDLSENKSRILDLYLEKTNGGTN